MRNHPVAVLRILPVALLLAAAAPAVAPAADDVRAAIEAAGRQFSADTSEVNSGGDYAYEVGTYEIGTAPGAVVDRGKFMVVWKKAGGKWWIYRDMFSSNAPPPAPASN